MKQEQSDFHDVVSAQFKGMGDSSWINADVMRGYPYPESTNSGHKRLQVLVLFILICEFFCTEG